MKSFYHKIFANNISFYIRQALRDYFANKISENDILNLSFDTEKFDQEHEINFKELLLEICKNNKNEAGFSDFKNYLNGENDKFKLTMSFDKAVFENYPSFDELRCHKLSFSNTIFKKGVRLRHIDVDEVLFEPRELGADATFFHREKANIDEGILRGKEIGRIGKFKYRHQLEGNGTTFLIGMRFTEKAEFTDCVLDKVQFSYLDEDSMSKCFFANSIIGSAKFYNCTFKYRPNTKTPFHLSEDKSTIFTLTELGDKSEILKWAILLVLPLVLLAVSPLLIEIISPPYDFLNTHEPNAILFFPFVFILAFLYILICVSLFSATYFMLFLKGFEKISEIVGLKPNHHISTGDDTMVEIDNEHKKTNRETVREIYRQLKLNYESNGDYQQAGEFYYSQRYWEMMGNDSGLLKTFSSQLLLLYISHLINGFGERWFRAFVWFILTITVFAFLAQPNEDFISTKSTPEYFLNASQETNETCKLYFNESNVTDKSSNKAHFILIAKTSFEDGNITYKPNGEGLSYTPDKNKTIYAFDNRFDYHYTTQYIPMLKNDYDIKIAYSLSKMIAPFVSEEKKWFQDRSERGYYLGFLESILLWIFFVAFLLAVKNRIRR